LERLLAVLLSKVGAVLLVGCSVGFFASCTNHSERLEIIKNAFYQLGAFLLCHLWPVLDLCRIRAGLVCVKDPGKDPLPFLLCQVRAPAGCAGCLELLPRYFSLCQFAPVGCLILHKKTFAAAEIVVYIPLQCFSPRFLLRRFQSGRVPEPAHKCSVFAAYYHYNSLLRTCQALSLTFAHFLRKIEFCT
jgi:hypothetical protein